MTDSTAYRGLVYRNRRATSEQPQIIPPGPGPGFDPASLSLTGWWKGEDYDASGTGLWTGTASAGTSASHDWYDNTFAGVYKPAVGATINGIATVGMTDNFRWLETNVNATDLIDTTEGTIIIVANITSVGTTDANVNLNDRLLYLFGGFGGIAAHATAPSIQMVSYDGTYDHEDISFTLSTTTVFTWRLNGGKIYSRKDKDAFGAGVSAGAIANIAVPFVTSSPSNVVGRYGEIIMGKGLSLADCDDIVDYLSTRWNLGL